MKVSKCLSFLSIIILMLFSSSQSFALSTGTSTNNSTVSTTAVAIASTVLTTPDNQYNYSINNNEVTIVKYLDSDANVTIPKTIDGCLVTGIGDTTFRYNATLISINTNKVTTIGNVAFQCNSLLESAIIPEVTTINSVVFQNM